jgi:hypothetical protein
MGYCPGFGQVLLVQWGTVLAWTSTGTNRRLECSGRCKRYLKYCCRDNTDAAVAPVVRMLLPRRFFRSFRCRIPCQKDLWTLDTVAKTASVGPVLRRCCRDRSVAVADAVKLRFQYDMYCRNCSLDSAARIFPDLE